MGNIPAWSVWAFDFYGTLKSLSGCLYSHENCAIHVSIFSFMFYAQWVSIFVKIFHQISSFCQRSPVSFILSCFKFFRFSHSSSQRSLCCDFRSFSATLRASQHNKVHLGIHVNSYFNAFGIFFRSTSLCILAEMDFLFDWNTMTSTNCLQPSNCWDLTEVNFNYLFTKSFSSFYNANNASGFLIRNAVMFWEIQRWIHDALNINWMRNLPWWSDAFDQFCRGEITNVHYSCLKERWNAWCN